MGNIKSILVPVDGSEIAVRAVGKAAELAALYDAEIILLYVSLLPEDTDDTKRAAKSWLSGLATVSVKRLSREILQQAAAVLPAGIRYITCVRVGKPEEVIADFAEQKQVDIVVMGSHSTGAVRGFLLGSVSQSVLEEVQQPVVIVK